MCFIFSVAATAADWSRRRHVITAIKSCKLIASIWSKSSKKVKQLFHEFNPEAPYLKWQSKYKMENLCKSVNFACELQQQYFAIETLFNFSKSFSIIQRMNFFFLVAFDYKGKTTTQIFALNVSRDLHLQTSKYCCAAIPLKIYIVAYNSLFDRWKQQQYAKVYWEINKAAVHT